MNLKEKADATSNQRSNSWKNYYEVPKQMFNQVRNYIPSSIADYWSGNFGFGSNTIGTCYFQPHKKSKGNMEKTGEELQSYVVDSNNYSMYNQYVYDITTRSQQPVNVVQNKESFLFDSSIPPPCSSKSRPSPSQSVNPQSTADISRQNQSHRGQFFGANSLILPKAPGGEGYIKCRAAPSATWWAGSQPVCGTSRQQQQHQQHYPFPTQQWQLGNMSSMTSMAGNMLWDKSVAGNMLWDKSVADNMLDTATDILVQYICQETEHYPSSVKSNLNPDAKEFIPNHLVDHYHKNQNSEYLNKAMLETAIKSSMEDVSAVRASKAFYNPVKSPDCGEPHGCDNDNTEGNTVTKTTSFTSDKKDLISAYKKSASQHSVCDKDCVGPNQIISDFNQPNADFYQINADFNQPKNAPRSFQMINRDSQIQCLTNGQEGLSHSDQVKSSQCLQEEKVLKLNQDARLQNCDIKQTSCTSGHCDEEAIPIVHNKMQVKAINDDISSKSYCGEEDDIPSKSWRGHKDDISNTSLEDDFTLEDLMNSKCCLSSSSCDSESSDNSKSVSRNLSESSDDSLIQFHNSSQQTSPGIPKLVRLDSTEVNVVSDEISDDGSDIHDDEEDGEESDWDEVSCDGQDFGDLMEFFPTGLCLTNLRPAPVSTACFSLPCLSTTSPPHCFLPDPANFTPCVARVNSICLVSPTTIAFDIPEIMSFNRGCIEKGITSTSSGVKKDIIEDEVSNVNIGADTGDKNTEFGVNRSEDLERVNRDWKSIPDKSRLRGPVVQFSCSPVQVILEPDNLADDLKQARISDFPRRCADKERMERLIAPILTAKHRQNIYQKLYSNEASNNNDNNKTLGLSNSCEDLNS